MSSSDLLISNLAISSWPKLPAKSMGKQPFWSGRAGEAPLFKSSFTVSKSPWNDAQCSAVQSVWILHLFISIFYLRRLLMKMLASFSSSLVLRQFMHAIIRGVSPLIELFALRYSLISYFSEMWHSSHSSRIFLKMSQLWSDAARWNIDCPYSSTCFTQSIKLS